MAASVITTLAKEESTFIITVAPTDDTDVAVTPQTMLWTLTDLDGTVINSRTAIDFETDNGNSEAGTLSTSMAIILNGDDLQITGSGDANEKRILTIEGTYNSDAGTGLPYTDQVIFIVENLKAV